jgi:hypothetical protein
VDVNTGGGPSVGNDIETGGGSFVGRDRQQNSTTVNVDIDALYEIRADISKIQQDIRFIERDIDTLGRAHDVQATDLKTLHTKTDALLQTQQQPQGVTIRDAISIGISLLVVIAVAVLIGIYIGGLAR